MKKSEFTALEAAMARDWLNSLILVHRQRKNLSVFSGLEGGVSAPVINSIFLDGRIDLLAELLGLELKEDECRHSGIYLYHFTYNGEEFIADSEERPGGYAEGAGQEIPGGQVPADAGTV